MRDYVILTDSCCDLSAEMAAELGVEVLPLSLQMGDRTYRNYLDGREIGFHEFYERIRSGELATTSAVNVGEFEEKMREILKTGKDILSISFSSALSTTYQSSVIAAEELRSEFPDARIETVDTLCASLGQGLLVYLCAMEKQKGRSLDEVKTFAEQTRLHVCHWFTVDDLNHLKRGGRIGKITAMAGTALGIKPILAFDPETGELTSAHKVRGRQAAMKKLVQVAVSNLEPNKRYNIMWAHGGTPEEGAQIAEMLRKAAPDFRQEFSGEIDCTLASYVGPRLIGAAVQVLDDDM